MFVLFFFLMIRRPPRSTQSGSSAASDVYKRQALAEARRRGARLPPEAELRRQVLDALIDERVIITLSLIHISEPTRLLSISYAVFCLKKKINLRTTDQRVNGP